MSVGKERSSSWASTPAGTGFKATLDDLGIRLAEDQVDEVYSRFLELADRKKTVTAADLIALVSDELDTPGDGFTLNRWNASLGSAGPATASVIITAAMASSPATARATARSMPSSRRSRPPPGSRTN